MTLQTLGLRISDICNYVSIAFNLLRNVGETNKLPRHVGSVISTAIYRL